MSTASDTAPAAQRSLERGADNSVRARRTEQGLSRVELAARVEVGRSTIAGIENGHHRPSLELGQKIADALSSEVAELFTLRECECGCSGVMIDQARLGSSSRYLSGHNCRRPEHAAAATRAHRARRERLGIPEEKICERCGRTFTRSEVPRQSIAHWLERRYCDGDCRWPVRAQERNCEHCGELIPRKVMSDNRDRRFHCRSCGQLNRWERGDIPAAVVAQLPGRARRIRKLKWAPKPGRRRLDERHDYEEALERIRAKYEETHASERNLELLTGESRTMVRLALGRPLKGRRTL
jgi:DNA-binding XRE family transcriptional regulator